MKSIQFSGPTNFSEIIKQSIECSKLLTHKDPCILSFYFFLVNYSVLLILTDGCISDMRETLGTIVDGSSCPLSIIIIGIGDADFDNMIILDGDDIVRENFKFSKRKVYFFIKIFLIAF